MTCISTPRLEDVSGGQGLPETPLIPRWTPRRRLTVPRFARYEYGAEDVQRAVIKVRYQNPRTEVRLPRKHFLLSTRRRCRCQIGGCALAMK